MQDQKNNFGETYKEFSKRDGSALCIQYTTTENAHYPTITVELAPFNKAADWSKKIAVQLTKKELTAFVKTSLCLLPSCEGSYHGENRNKGFTLHNNNEKGMILRVSEAGNFLQISLSPEDRVEIRAFVIARLAAAWKMSVVDVVSIIRYP